MEDDRPFLKRNRSVSAVWVTVSGLLVLLLLLAGRIWSPEAVTPAALESWVLVFGLSWGGVWGGSTITRGVQEIARENNKRGVAQKETIVTKEVKP